MRQALDKAMASLGAVERKGGWAEAGLASWLVPYRNTPPKGYLSTLVVTSTSKPKIAKNVLAERVAKLRSATEGNEYQALRPGPCFFYAIERDEWVDFNQPIHRELIAA